MVSLSLGPLLEKSLPYHPWIDVLRALGIFLAVVTSVLLIYLTWCLGKRKQMPPKPDAPNPLDPVMVCSLLSFQTFSILQEVQQIGHPFVVWRLPLLVLGSVFASVGIARRL